MSARRRAALVLGRLDPQYAGMTTGLNFETPEQLLFATILSAQCTDERVNQVTPELFHRFPTVNALAEADPEELECVIHSCGFFRNKAKNLQGAAAALRDRFAGGVPGEMNDLVSLPGVARKTANVVLAHAFDRHQGIAVDTHVGRLARRLRLTEHAAPEKVERDLMAVVPRRHWGRVSDVLIWHGRKVCFARRPACATCLLADICPSAGVG